MFEFYWTAPLAHREPFDEDEVAISIEDRSDIGVIDLRLAHGNLKGRAAAGKALGLKLPRTPRSSTASGELRVLWFSIDQWLIIAPRERIAELVAGLEAVLDGHARSVVDVSHMRAVLRLSGDHLRAVLAKCLSVDVFADEIKKGFVRRVTFGEIAAAIHIVQDDPIHVDLYVFRSYVDYAMDWLLDAGRRGSEITLFESGPPPPL